MTEDWLQSLGYQTNIKTNYTYRYIFTVAMTFLLYDYLARTLKTLNINAFYNSKNIYINI